MDPNTTLSSLRKLASNAIATADDSFDDSTDVMDALNDANARLGELGEIFLALDQWIVKGGVLPSDWRATRG